jgi:hypothetical protein
MLKHTGDGLYVPETLKKDDTVYNAENRRITNVASPVMDKDAMNKQYLDWNALVFKEEGFDARNERICNLHSAREGGDAISKSYLEENAMILGRDTFDARNKRITHLLPPKFSHNAANKGYVDGNTMTLVEGRKFSAQNRKISDVSNPAEDKDVVNLDYLQNRHFPIAMRFYFKGTIQNNASQFLYLQNKLDDEDKYLFTTSGSVKLVSSYTTKVPLKLIVSLVRNNAVVNHTIVNQERKNYYKSIVDLSFEGGEALMIFTDEAFGDVEIVVDIMVLYNHANKA